MVKAVFVSIVFPFLLTLTAHADLVPAALLTDWTPGVRVGVPGGIDQYLPGGANTRTNLIDVTQAPYNADNTGATNASPAINSAVAVAGNGQVVYLPAGTYRLDSAIYIPFAHNNFSIRGAGPTKTIIKAGSDGIYFGASDDWIYPSTPATVMSGLSKDSTSIVLDDASAFSIGKIIRIAFPDQTDDTALENGAVINFAVGGPMINNGLRKQVCRVTAISGNTLTIFPGIYRTPDTGLSAAKVLTALLQNDGVAIEDLAFDMSNSNGAFGILMEHCYACWINNVSIYNVANYAVDLEGCLQCEIRHCNFHDRQTGGSNGAGILLNTVSGSLFEDNMISNIIPSFEVNAGSSGNVFSYNLLENPPISGAIGFGADSNHGPHNSFNLWEGNISPNLISDGYFGSDSENTVIRNWFHGSCYDSSATTFTFALERFTRNYVIVGNILGKNGVQQGTFSYGNPNLGNGSHTGTCQPTMGIFWNDWKATAIITTRASDTGAVLTLNSGSLFAGQFANIQWNNASNGQSFTVASINGLTATYNGGSGNALPIAGTVVNLFTQPGGFQELDLDVQTSTVEKGNYTYGTSGGAGSMSSLGGDTLPTSLEYSNKPSWFNSLAWPPFDPANPDAAGYEAIPAGYRFVHGTDPLGGGSNTPPGIIAQPTNTSVTVGQSATFGVTATGTAPLSYQWQTNAVNVPGATNVLYTTPATTPADNGTAFKVIVTNSKGSVTSGVATLTVFTNIAPPTGFSAWTNMMNITFSGYNKAETLTNFPALVVLSTNLPGFSYSHFASTNGYDLRFSADGSTELNYEIEQWNPGGSSYVWVQVPQLSAGSSIWAYWGNAGAAAGPAGYTINGAVWPTNAFAAVWHMNQPNTTDSTANGNNGMGNGSVSGEPGIVGNAQNMAGDSGRVSIPNSSSLSFTTTQATYSGWVCFNTLSSGEQVIMRKAQNRELGFSDPGHVRDMLSTTGTSGWTAGNDDPVGSPIAGQWYYLAFTYNGSVIRNFWNGSPLNAGHAVTGTINGDPYTVGLGAYNGNTDGGPITLGLDAIVDEVRVEQVFRSPNWILATYLTVASNASFSAYGSVQVNGGSTNTPAAGIPPSVWIQQYFPGTPTNNYASLAASDVNSNGMTVWQDYLAGINPTNQGSSFSVLITNVAGQIIVTVPSVQTNSDYTGVNRYYEIDECTNLMAGAGWQTVSGYAGVPANSGTLACTNAAQKNTTFYRAKVLLQ
jgi:hypothetical protein